MYALIVYVFVFNIQPRSEEERIDLKLEMKRYKENKEKIKRQKAEAKRRKIEPVQRKLKKLTEGLPVDVKEVEQSPISFSDQVTTATIETVSGKITAEMKDTTNGITMDTPSS